MAVMTMSPIDAVERYLGAMERSDLEAMGASLDPDVRWLNERTGQWERGADELVAYSRDSLEGATDVSEEIQAPVSIEAGDHAVVSGLLMFRATWSGERYEIPCPATFVVRRAGEGWTVVYQHTLEYRAREVG